MPDLSVQNNVQQDDDAPSQHYQPAGLSDGEKSPFIDYPISDGAVESIAPEIQKPQESNPLVETVKFEMPSLANTKESEPAPVLPVIPKATQDTNPNLGVVDKRMGHKHELDIKSHDELTDAADEEEAEFIEGVEETHSILSG